MPSKRQLAHPIVSSDADRVMQQIFGNSAAQAKSGIGDLDQVDIPAFCFERFKRQLFDYQEKIVRMFWDRSIREADILAARQCGKTDACAVGVLGAAAANFYPTMEGYTAIGWFANKEDQSVGVGGARCWRLLESNYDKWSSIWDKDGSNKAHLAFKKDAGVNSRLLGTIDFKTANPQAFSEGQTFSFLMIDEANRLNDMVWSEIILPMGGSTNAKIVKAGVPRLKNNFYDTAMNPTWTHISVDWVAATIFAAQFPCELKDPVTGTLIGVFGGYPLKRMPLSLKRQLFPTNPILHILANKHGQKEQWLRLWDWPGDMSEDDFRTQYMLEWLVDVSLFLKLDQQDELFKQGKHKPMERGVRDEVYFYGFDPCGEEAIDGFGGERTKKANAALSVWRRNGDGTKDKVFCDSRRTGTSVELIEWVEERTHPERGLFKCVAGCWDETGSVGNAACNEARRRGLPMLPVMYPKVCPETGKNWKNTIFEHFGMELGMKRVHYPDPAHIHGENTVALYDAEGDPVSTNPNGPGGVYIQHKDEWETVEKKVTSGINADIRAPGNLLDDGPNSDCLGVYLADNYPKYKTQLGVRTRATRGAVGPGAMSGSGASAGPSSPSYPVYLGT